jgi:opacity protein-like surface antigen
MLGRVGGCAVLIASLFAGTTAQAHEANNLWTGLFLGASVGQATGKGLLDKGPDGAFFPFGDTKPELTGTVHGVHLGYQKQFGKYTLGAEISYLDGKVGGTGVDPERSTESQVTVSVDKLLMANLRVGYVTDHWHLYATAGYARANVTGRYVDTREPIDGFVVATPPFFQTKAHDGWNVGAGMDIRLTPHILLGADVRYVDLKNEVHLPIMLSAPINGTAFDRRHGVAADVTIAQVRLTFIEPFGWTK